MKRNFISLVLLFILQTGFAQEVKMEARPLTLPTYEIAPPDLNPIFYTGRVYQGAQGHIYPYPLFDVLTAQKGDKTYNALYLENEYVNVCVLPEIGGRILSAIDKTNNYDIFYRQTGIKPALIGMLGAWLSGGVEWNIPHHHRATSYMPIDWEMEENPDGSKTIWVGETEIRHRLKWSIGLTLYPDRSWIEARVRIMNRTPFIQSILYWANVSVHCDENYEVIFPPATQAGTDHSKVYFTPWPMGDPVKGTDIIADLAWWKNYIGSSRSIFAWNYEDDFFAGYDHAKHAGTVHVANHHVVCGKKFFLWGNNPRGEMWNTMLSDANGPYLELMVGAYSDNQPDYSWIGPGETREFTQRWYGLRDIRGVKNANDNAAVNIERTAPEKLFFGFNATTKYPGAHVVLKNGDATLLQETITIDPATPYLREIIISTEAKDSDFEATLFDANGNELVAYRPVVLEEKPLPDVVEGTKQPEEYKTVEELYLAGLRIEQFHNARLNAMDFYNEALKHDPMDARTNTVVGIRHAREGRWGEAETHLSRAVARLSKDYTTIKDTEPIYYLGLVYQMQRKYKEAEDMFWKATWYPTFQHPAYTALAQIAALQQQYDKALILIDQSLNVGSQDTKALTFKAYLLRKSDQKYDAYELLDKVFSIDPLDYWSLSELSILNGNGTQFLANTADSRGDGLVRIQALLEMVMDYANIGAYPEALALLEEAIKTGKPYSTYPMVYYYAGYYNLLSGNSEAAANFFAQASKQPTDYCFPFRLEEIDILECALNEQPSDYAAAYYLGNLYYFLNQHEKGIASWEKSAQLNPKFYHTFRNLGFACNRSGNVQKAVTTYEQAIALDKNDPRLFSELDQLYEKTHKPARERLALLEKNIKTVYKHDDAVVRLLMLYNETGAYNKSLALLDSRHFHVWEGGSQVHNIFVDANLMDGLKKMDSKKYPAAIDAFKKADSYPVNLELGRPYGGGHSAKGFYYMGDTYKLMSNPTKAAEAYGIAANVLIPRDETASESAFYKAMALREIGKRTDADNVIEAMKKEVERQLNSASLIDEYSKFGEDGSDSDRLAHLSYLQGLIAYAEGDTGLTKTLLQKALLINSGMIWPKLFLERMK